MTLRRMSTSDPASTVDIHAAPPIVSAWICFQEVNNVVVGVVFCVLLCCWFFFKSPYTLHRMLLRTVSYTILLQNYTSGVSKYFNLFHVGLQYCLLGILNMKTDLELDPKRH